MRCHLLVDGETATLIDSGLLWEHRMVGRLLEKLGLGWSSVRAILLTHGHLDHAANLSWIQRRSGAPIYAHPAERAHVAGVYPYRGAARVCGAMEAFGRFVLRHQPAEVNIPLEDGQELPFWGGLRVVHLPGHTEGHCGFFSIRHGVLFSGDLVASYFHKTALPPAILNSCPERLAGSLAKVQALNPEWIIPNHYDTRDLVRLRSRIQRLLIRGG